MAASDQTYRNQRALDIVFGASCLLMLAGTVWMFAQDYYREYKVEARDFRDVEEALYERQMLDLVPDQARMEEIAAAETELAKAREAKQTKIDEHKSEINQLLPKKVSSEAKAQSIKADYDSKVSLYNIAVEDRNAAKPDSPEYQTLSRRADALLQEVHDLEDKLKAAQVTVREYNEKLEAIRQTQKAEDERVSKAEDKLKKLTEDFDRFAKLAVQKRWTIGDAFRKLPVIDAFSSPTRIQQITLNELPIDYNFKYVTRYDRCTTCHQGIDRKAFTKEALAQLTKSDDKLEAKLANARTLLAKRKEILKKQSTDLDPSDLKGVKVLPASELTKARVNEFCAHPRLDLFVDGNSAHPAEKFGCTICHAGQGSATDFHLAAHTPNNPEQKKEWEEKFGWEGSHFWDYPMYSKRFVESSCLKCHHQVAGLLPEGEKGEYKDGQKVDDAPGSKVVRGYNLVRENGCFGCHEIAGMKDGRAVGPDLRLELPESDLTPDGRPKGHIDPLNPPGTMRKVGPSLFRLSEKTNETWAWNWIHGPRNFRPNTRMPHFYHLSNNNEDALAGTGQELFPDTEIHSITHYLFTESRNYVGHLPEDQQLLHGVEVPPPLQGKDLDKGRQLFTERGCLACHSHDSTTKAEGQPTGAPNEPNYLPGVESKANFGPNLNRLRAKIGTKVNDPASGRRWLIQWILNPKLHSPRTYMPYMHLEPAEAAAVADWLLSQPSDWQPKEPTQVDVPALEELAKTYLGKIMSPEEARNLIESKGFTPQQITDLRESRPDADELKLSAWSNDQEKIDKLQWYVGKKTIGSLGCFGCHNIPGFENAKPIGTPLNDWGKKDPERLAFEDVIAYVDRNHPLVNHMSDDKDIHGQPVQYAPGHEPYEEYFYQSLKHHQREGFLHQKLLEPRSYDYERLRAWEDRLRMPQFRFARTLKGKDESDEEYAARAEKEEADAREAVMTFILGLIAEPVPLQYVYDPPPDRLAQVKGVEVLDRFNCAGCHMVRPGIYQFARKPVLDDVESAYKELLDSTTYQADHHFENHNAWTGLASPQADLLTIHGLPSADKDETLRLRLVQALRFTKKPEDVKDIHDAGELPAGTYDLPAALKDLELAKNQLVYRDDPQGGTFAELLAPYLVARKRDRLNDAGNARAGLPPPLFREGEKTQPGWLFQFLKDPPKIREVTILRMPRFSLSDDDAQALVNYFAAVDQTQNPGIDLTYPYLMVPEHDAGYLQQKSEQYLQRLAQDGAKGRTYTGDAFRTLTSVTLCLNCHRVGNVAKDVNEAPSAPNLALAQERLRPDWLVRWIASPQVMLVYDQGQHPMPQQFPANKIQYPDLFLGLAAKQLPPQLATSLQAAQAKVQEARQAEDKEKDAAKKKDLEAARMKAESALDQIVPNFLKEGEAKVKAAREAEITETDSDKKKELAAARQKVEDEFQLARKEVELYSLNQVAALRDVLMNLNQVAEQSNQRPASPATGGGR